MGSQISLEVTFASFVAVASPEKFFEDMTVAIGDGMALGASFSFRNPLRREDFAIAPIFARADAVVKSQPILKLIFCIVEWFLRGPFLPGGGFDVWVFLSLL